MLLFLFTMTYAGKQPGYHNNTKVNQEAAIEIELLTWV
jgi:hypothetical protein